MQKQLNQVEIDQILHFLKRHKVPYFDVQLELVDHFASAIESNWETYPNHWSLEQKILSVYNEIGPKGFTKIIGEKGSNILQRANKFALNLLKDSLKIPQIIVTIACIYFLHQGFLTMENPAHLFAKGLSIPMISVILTSFVAYGFYWWRYKQRILALENSISFHMIGPNLLMMPVYWIDKANFHFSSEMYLLFSVMIFVQIIYCTGLLLVIRKIFVDAKNRYAHLSKA